MSAPRLPDELIRTSDVIYVRLHGRSRWYRHDYTCEELNEWADKIAASGAREAWIYFDNDREGYAIKNAQQLIGHAAPARTRGDITMAGQDRDHWRRRGGVLCRDRLRAGQSGK